MSTSVSGINVTITYTEPTTNADGTTLSDLHHITIYYDIGAGAVHAVDLPASLNVGGGNGIHVFSVPAADGKVTNVKLWLTATDNSGNESVRSVEVDKIIDRLAPNPPTF